MNRVQLGIWVSTAAIIFAQPLQAASPLTATDKEDTKIDQTALYTYLEQYGHDVDLLAVEYFKSKTDSSVELPTQATKEQRKEQPTLIAQTPEVLVPNPKITIEENAAPPSEANTDSPVEENAVPTIPTPTAPAPPVLPRAVAPPVGDIAVSNIDSTPDMIDLGTEVLVPRLVVKDAPAREVLAVLARFAGLNLVFTDQAQPSGGGEGAEGAAAAAPTGASGGPTISLDLEDEPVQEVFNSVLMVSGLNANRRGNTIFVGTSLPDTARNLISRTLRLNQVQANAASTFLATQGAEVQQIVTPVEDVVDPETNRVVRREEQPPQLQPLAVAQAEGSMAPLLLNGLKVSTDDRLNSITLVGEPRKVEIATSFLTQLDARRRQVSVNVKVIDVNLLNTDDFNTSFSFGINDTFFAQDQGTAILNFGENSPPNAAQVRGSSFFPAIVPLQSTIVNGGSVDLDTFFDPQNAPFDNVTPGNIDGAQVPFARPSFGTNNNPFQPGVTEVTPPGEVTTEVIPVEIDPATGQPTRFQILERVSETGEYLFSPPSLFQFPKKFLLNLEAQVQSGNAKILTDPTLTVQEGQEATVRLVQDVVVSVDTQIDPESGVRTVEPVLGEAGLVLNVNVERIDDNGFVNLSVSPVVSAIGSQQVFESGGGAENILNLLNRRELSSGLIRLRDGQTLILSGIIQESDQTTVSKVPILGDIPILGALFRSTNKSNERREVIVLLTPQIVDERSDFGYNYVPGKDARDLMRQRGLTVPGNP